MNTWRVAAAVAGLGAVLTATPAQASDWCIHDPQVVIQAPGHHTLTVYVTEGALGSEHQAALESARLFDTTSVSPTGGLRVTIYVYVPNDKFGRFPTEMTVSSAPFGAGVVYGSTFGTSGSFMVVSFKIQKWAR